MANIKENEIPKKLTDLTEDWWFRIVNNDSTKSSGDMLKSILRLPQAQIDGLVAALAGKVATPTIKSQLAFVQAAGLISGSGLNSGMITDEASLNLAFNGFYSAVTPFAVDDLGFIKNVLAFDNSVVGESTVTPSVRTMSRQLIFSTIGILYREWALSGWGTPIFMGGTNANYAFSRADLITFAGNNKLTPGALYKITDHGNDEGIIIQAAASSTFSTDGIRLGLVPAHYQAGDYTFGVYTSHWIGVWRASIGDAGVSIGDRAVFMGRVWYNETGNIGTVDGSDSWSLDSTNWTLLPVTFDEHYVRMVFGCTYDIATDYISKQWDNKGNEFGEPIAPDDDFKVEYNDWSFGIDTGCRFTNNKLKRCYSNTAKSGAAIYDNAGVFSIISNSLSTQVAGEITEIYSNTLDSGNISSNTIANSSIAFNNLRSGSAEITSNTMVDTTGISSNVLDGSITGCSECSIVGTTVKSSLNNIGCNSFGIYNSEIYSALDTITLSENITIRESVGKICASISIAAGTFTIATGETYLAKAIATGMTIATIRSNGVTVSGQTLIAQYAGWHHVKATMSLNIGTGSVFESAIFVNSSAVAGLYDKVVYSADNNKRVEIDNYVLLAVGDVVSIRHKHDQAGTLTYPHYSSSFTLEYDN